MNRDAFGELLRGGPLLADGGTGTSLVAAGARPDACLDELNLTEPDVVREVHRAFVQAGARLVVTNTFGANRYKLARVGLDDRLAEVNAAGARLAREAGAQLVGGSVGPLGVRLAPYGRVQPAEARAAFAEQVAALVAGGADLIVIETHSDLAEIEQAIEAARRACDLPVVATLTFTRDDRTLLGETAEIAAARLAELGVDAMGVNCSEGPSQVLRLVNAMRPHANGVPMVAKPNAGGPQRLAGRVVYPATAEYLGEYAAAFADAGVAILGGCCGTEPAHIAAMAGALAAPRGVGMERGAPSEIETFEPLPAEGPTRLARSIADGGFVIAVEMAPPRGYAPQRLVAGAQTLGEAGADTIVVTDSPLARMRMSPWAACHLVQRETGIESVLAFPTRGRNIMRIQGDLLAAYALGIRNLFVLMGDPTQIGERAEAGDRADVTPSGLIALIKGSFNEGRDRSGESIGAPTSFVVGCALNLNAADPEREARTLRRKIESGADFAFSQPIYDPARLLDFRAVYEREHGPLALPILVGVLPLASGRHAEFLHNEVAGIEIPEEIRVRMAAAGDGRKEGLALATDLGLALRSAAAGAYLIPPFGRYDLAAELIERIRS